MACERPVIYTNSAVRYAEWRRQKREQSVKLPLEAQSGETIIFHKGGLAVFKPSRQALLAKAV